MDHIWLDPNGQAEPEHVELFDKVKYDGAGFADYLGRLDLTAETLLRNLQQTHLHDDHTTVQARTDYLNSVFQEWLFVAAITEVFAALDLTIPRETWIKVRGNAQYLTTQHLRVITTGAFARAVFDNDISAYMDAYRTGSASMRLLFEREVFKRSLQHRKASKGLWAPQRMKNVTTIVNNTLSTAAAFLHVSFPSDGCLSLSNWVACRILNESLQSLFFWFFGIDWEYRARPDPAQIWTRAAVDRKLCPYRTNKLYIAVTVTDAYIASSLTPRQTQDHSSCTSHAYCSAPYLLDACPSHRPSCDRSCVMLRLSGQDTAILEDALSTGHWGVLRFDNDEPGSATFCMESSSSCPTSFVAFSHVWAHGLGNPEANALWSCQLLSLKQVMVRAGCAKMGFWLDPLCVPLNSALKMKAVAQMDQIYAAADKTIVLDSNLEHQRGPSAIKIAHVLISDWLTRIWTLQEALLPKEKLYFLFDDGVHSVKSLTAHPYNTDSFDMTAVLINITWRDELLTNLRLASDHPLISLVESFQLRSTTRREDEVICLAILCGIPTDTLPIHPQLHHIIGKMDTVPQDLIYAIGPRSKAPGFGWMVESFISKDSYKKYQPTQTMVPRGHRGICMHKVVARIASPFTFDPTFSTNYRRHFKLFEQHSSGSPYRIAVCDADTLSVPEQALTRKIEQGALVFEHALDRDVSAAILVSDLHVGEDKHLHARYEARMITISLNHFMNGVSDADQYPYADLIAPAEPPVRIWIA